MSKYIDIEIHLKKTMKVDSDDLNQAIDIAKQQLADLELTQEWLDARDISFKENPIIKVAAEKCAELFCDAFDDKDLNDFIDISFGNEEIKDYVYDETLKILKDKYQVDISNIKI